MDKFGDPTFGRHVAVAKVLGIATLRLADSLILPINVTGSSSHWTVALAIQLTVFRAAYATELSYYVSKVRDLPSFTSHIEDTIHLSNLDDAVSLVQHAAAAIDAEIEAVEADLAKFAFPPTTALPCLRKLMKKVRSINKRLQAFEGGFITDEGLPQRPWYRSRAVAPGRYLGYGELLFASSAPN